MTHSAIQQADVHASEHPCGSEERYRFFFEQSQDAMMTLAPPSWHFTSGNPAACAMFGARDEAEFITLGPWDLSPPYQPDGRASPEQAREAIETAMREGSCFFHWTHCTRDGRNFPSTVLLTRMNIGEEVLLQAIVRNISAQREAEQALRTERDLFSAGPVCIMVWGVGAQWPVRQVSSNVSAILGYTPEDMMAPDFRFSELIHPDDLARVVEEVSDYIARGKNDFEQSYRLKCKNGDYRWFYDFSRLMRNLNGEVELIHGYLFDQTRMKDAEAELDQQRRRLEDILRGTRSGTWEWNVQTGEVVFNERWAEMIGYTLEELAPLSIETWMTLTHPDDLRVSQYLLEQHFEGQLDYYDCDVRIRHKDGHWIWVQDRGKVSIWHEDGRPHLMRGTHIDITDRKRTEERLELVASVFTHVREGVIITDAEGIIIDINAAFTQITGYPREEVLGQNPRLLQSGRQSAEFYQDLWHSLVHQGYWSGELWNQRKNGELYAATLTISAVCDEQGNTRHYVGLFTDITQLKEHQRQLEHLAHYDALTTLPNRVLLAERLQQAIALSREHDTELALAYLDLDGFKPINDFHGHQIGDQLLITLAARMKHELRSEDTLARLGGDEFVAVLVDLPDRATAEAILQRLLNVVNLPVRIGEIEHRVTVSIGVTLYPQGEDVDADQLLRQADQAMYQAKLAGKNSFYYFDAEYDRHTRGRHESLEHIRHALANGELRLYYQPKVNMRTGEVVGAEALIRWQHPERGLLPPAVFLPVIEDHPLGVELGHWVIDTALSQIERWHARGLALPVSVNVGARQLQQSDFAQRLTELLATHPGIDPSRFGLEVLETSAFEDLSSISRVITECCTLGVDVALDDFGTGYSSLTYLKRLPANILKIDQSFVRDMLDDPEDLAIVESVLGLSMTFRRGVIAEGVETREHGELLLQLGCEIGQGYGIARPMSAEAIPAWVAAWKPDPSWLNCTPVPRSVLPLIHASVEHRAWIGSIRRVIEGALNNQSVPDMEQCNFSDWLRLQPRTPVIQDIEAMHREAHALGQLLLELHAQGQTSAARTRLETLLTLSARLLKTVQTLVPGTS